ncbi:MAG: hypothetical protein RL760_1472 [Candidatus Eisenbacteria bacterium]
MSPMFRVNFRREAFRRQRAEARARALGLGGWLAYFGIVALLLGLYGLHTASLAGRTARIERQVARLSTDPRSAVDWRPTPTDAAASTPWVGDPGRWRALLGRLPALLPENARLTAIEWNPDDITGGDRRLVLTGVLRGAPAEDPMGRVTDFVTAVGRDSLFKARFRSVRLLSTRAHEGGEAEFKVECR